MSVGPEVSQLKVKIDNWCEYIARTVVDEIGLNVIADGFGPDEVAALERIAVNAVKNGAIEAFTSVLGVKPEGTIALIKLPDPPS